jgi:hypothetical protein
VPLNYTIVATPSNVIPCFSYEHTGQFTDLTVGSYTTTVVNPATGCEIRSIRICCSPTSDLLLHFCMYFCQTILLPLYTFKHKPTGMRLAKHKAHLFFVYHYLLAVVRNWLYANIDTPWRNVGRNDALWPRETPRQMN